MAKVAMYLLAALLVALPMSIAAQNYVYSVWLNAYMGSSTCSGVTPTTLSYPNGTECFNLFSTYYTNVSCDANGLPSGSVCSNGGCECGGEPLDFPSDTVWNEEVCFPGLTPATSIGCLRVEVPEAPEAISSPQVATPPVAVPEEEQGQEPVGLIGQGDVQVLLYFTNGCPNSPQTITFDADISQCQSYQFGGTDLYFRADCWTNSSSYGFYCESDSTCAPASCLPLPNAPSNTCVNVNIENLIKSVKFICPTVAAPGAPVEAPVDSPPTGPTPSGEGSSLQVLYAFIYIIAALAAILML